MAEAEAVPSQIERSVELEGLATLRHEPSICHHRHIPRTFLRFTISYNHVQSFTIISDIYNLLQSLGRRQGGREAGQLGRVAFLCMKEAVKEK